MTFEAEPIGASHPPRVAVVIVSYNTLALTLNAVDSALAARGVDVEVWVVDNASTDGSVEAVRDRYPGVHVMPLEENLGFGRANNVALDQVDAPFVLLLNSDARFAEPHGLRRLVEALDARPDAAVVGPRLESPGGVLEYSVRAYPAVAAELIRGLGIHRLLPSSVTSRLLAYDFCDHAEAGPADWLTGACLLIRGPVLGAVGGFDPAIFLFAEEMDLCWRIRRAGWGLHFDPAVTVVHHRGASAGGVPPWKERLAMAGEAYVLRKHRGWAYLVAFAMARCVGLAASVALQGAWGTVTGAAHRRRRARDAARGLVAWVEALLAGGARRPSSSALLPPAAREAP